jgi:hypothetical protein
MDGVVDRALPVRNHGEGVGEDDAVDRLRRGPGGGVALDDLQRRQPGGPRPRLREQRRTEVDDGVAREAGEPRAEALGIAARSAAEFDDTVAAAQRQHRHQGAAAVQQPVAEAVVAFRLRRVEGGEALGVRARGRHAAQHRHQHAGIREAGGHGANCPTWNPA